MLTKESLQIIESLKNAQSGTDVYHALMHVPIDNLKDMQKMIKHILNLDKERELHLNTIRN